MKFSRSCDGSDDGRTRRFLPGEGAGPPWLGSADWQPDRLYSPARRAYSVLVVDDHAVKCYAIARALRAAGYSVGEASSGQEAWHAFFAYAALVLDVHLPDIDGFALCREIRERAPQLPIVQVSSVLVEPEYQRAGREAGASAYLPDPELHALVTTLDRLLDIKTD